MNERSEKELLKIVEEMAKQHKITEADCRNDLSELQRSILKVSLAYDLVCKATNLTKDELAKAKLQVLRGYKNDIALSLVEYILQNAIPGRERSLLESFQRHTKKKRLETSVELLELIDSLTFPEGT